jgi:hypothetical protein
VHNFKEDGRYIRRDLPVQPRVSIPGICFGVLTEQLREMFVPKTWTGQVDRTACSCYHGLDPVILGRMMGVASISLWPL